VRFPTMKKSIPAVRACFKTIKAPVPEEVFNKPLKTKNPPKKGEFSRKKPSGVVATSVTDHSGYAPDVAPSHPAFLAKTGAILSLKQAPNPDAYVDGLGGWQRTTVQGLRTAVLANDDLDEVIKWGHLVYLSNGPVLLIRAEEHRVLFGFWRGKRLREIEGRLKPGGKYEMATVELREREEVTARVVRRLVKAAVGFNKTLGNPTDI
jgi:hypothetical protein